MSLSKTTSVLLLSLIALTGCATKNYGRMEPLAAKTASADCATIDAQLAETGQFRKQVLHESEFSGADVVAFLIDFGIGNAMEKSEALKSADEREAQLRESQRTLGCPAGVERAETKQPARYTVGGGT